MFVHEYQAKQLLATFGLKIPAGGVAATADEAEAVARTLSGPAWVVKAQIHAGARGPAGGIKMVHSVEDVRDIAELMLGAELVTSQTGPQGQTVRRVYIEQGCEVVRAIYLALLVDIDNGQLLFLASPQGGDSIEEVALRQPDQVIRLPVDPVLGPDLDQAQELAAAVDFSGAQAQTFIRYINALYQAFVDLDAALIELSPLAMTGDGRLLALDAKMSFDDNALFRHPTVKALRARESAEPTELAARQQGLNYVCLDGNIGTLAGGAGLALATLDAIVEAGGKPANFLDVPPVSRQSQVAGAVRLLLADQRLDSILINAFGGGIMRCDVIADGLIAALQTHTAPQTVPLAVRLGGVNADVACKALRDAGLDAHFCDDLASAAASAVTLAQNRPPTPTNVSAQAQSLLDAVKNRLRT